jgi:endoglucanase
MNSKIKNLIYFFAGFFVCINSFADISSNTQLADNYFTFTNQSIFTLFLNPAQSNAASYCVDQEGVRQDCKAYLLSGDTQAMYIAFGDGLNLNYAINAPKENNYNLNIQNQSVISFNATKITDANTILQNHNLYFIYTGKISANPQKYASVPLRGVNISGAEAAGEFMAFWLPGIADENYFVAAGMNTVRYPIRWEYLCADAPNCAKINQEYMAAVKTNISLLLSNGRNVVLDLHNYMRHFPLGQPTSGGGSGTIVTAQNLVDVWTTLGRQLFDVASKYNGLDGNNQLIFELMNEPENMKTTDVLVFSNAAIAALRKQKLSNLILIDGNSWSGLHSWFEVGSATDGKSNAEVLTRNNILDPNNHYALAVHQYFDSDGSGTAPSCQDPKNFEQYVKLHDFLNWINIQGIDFMITEFGSGSEKNCVDDVTWFLKTLIEQGNPHFLGWTAWVAGHGWSKDDFNNLSLKADGSEQTQMTDIYQQFLVKPAAQ